MKYGLFALLLLAAALPAAEPQFTADNQLKRPTDYREWVYLSSGLGMNYADNARESATPVFDNVFVEPRAYREFLKTGKWRQGTMFALELRRSAQEGSINKVGRFQQEVNALEVSVKDSKRFSDGWGYFDFGREAQVTKAIGEQRGCNACHNKNGAVENTFVQFYPTLIEVARTKGTLRVQQ